MFQELEPHFYSVMEVVPFVGEIVGCTGKSIDRVKMFPELLGDQKGANREVLVVKASNPLAISIRGLDRPLAPSSEGTRDGLVERSNSSTHLSTGWIDFFS